MWTCLCRYAQTDMMKLANRMQFGIPEESSLGQYAMTYFMLSGIIWIWISACLILENNYPCDTMTFCYHQVMAWGKVMACLDRQGVASYVSQLDKTNLLLKWPKSMLYLFFLQYNIWVPFSQHLLEMESSAKHSFQFSVLSLQGKN